MGEINNIEIILNQLRDLLWGNLKKTKSTEQSSKIVLSDDESIEQSSKNKNEDIQEKIRQKK